MTRHVILVGAARSGTKILRDVLATAAGVGNVPYDVPFIWRHGHPRSSHDRLVPEYLTARSKDLIVRYIDRYAAGSPPVVIEKTVGNTLRVPYVRAVFPDAVFVHLVRDGLDVVESTRRQWVAAPDRRYLLRKSRHFPVRLVPSYGLEFARNQMGRHRSSEKAVKSWGVRYPGMDHDVGKIDLLQVCARQWRWSVETATRDFVTEDIHPVEARYEELVRDPVHVITRVLDQLELAAGSNAIHLAASRIRPDRLGAGSEGLTPTERRRVLEEIGATRRGLGYPDTEPQSGIA